MRVLLLGPYPPPHGGVQTNLVAIRRFLLERRVPCAVINLTRFRQASAGQVFYPKSAFGVLRLLLRLRYDIVHLHLGGCLTFRLLGMSLLCTLLPRARSVLTFHSGGYASSPEGRSARYWTLRGFVFRRFDRIIGVNPEIIALFRRLGVRPERLRLIHPHALAAPSLDLPLPEGLESFFRHHRPVLLSVGLLEPEYDLPLQVEALGVLRERFQDAGLLLIGAGSLEQELRAQIASKPHAQHILLCGDVPHAVTLGAIAKSDLMLRTTLYDGDSIAVREALHLGTPVIATDNGMRPEGVDLIPASNLEALCQACQRRLREAAPRQRRPQAGEENIQAVFDLYRELTET